MNGVLAAKSAMRTMACIIPSCLSLPLGGDFASPLGVVPVLMGYHATEDDCKQWKRQTPSDDLCGKALTLPLQKEKA